MTPAERKALKAKAHKLDPVVHVGAKGITEEVIAEIDRALHAHELIKVRAASLDRDAREEAFGRIAEKTGAQAVQHIGKVFVLFRKKKDE
ncbi:MAG TPA: ribosome assembly RNA-binding protein YhbY [Burkholderiales bacterium]|jgi:RNA-binding protein|nr:ribosome assembly RNA-binding protein YhbY [Burkholderiales bacterium]